MLENLRNKINQILRENVDAPLYVEYLKDMSGENPFELGGKRWQFVWAKYPNGKRDIGVYAFGEDLVYNYESWRKMMGIDKGGENVGASLYDRHFRSDNKNLKEIEVDDENNIDDYYTSDETTDLSFTDDVDSEEKPDYDNDAFIEDKPSGGYNTSFAGKFLGNFEELDVCLASLKAEFKRTNYFPTIWFVSDHGNYWPIDDQGNEIKQSLNENVDEQDSTPKQELLSLQDGFFGTIQITKLTPASMAGYIGKININGTEYNFDAANNTGEWEYFIHGYKNHDENIAGERGFSGNIDELKYEFVDMFGNGKSTPSMIDENFERNKEIAEIIIQQLGGFGKLRAMTGAYNFVAIDNGVQFKIKNPKANCIKIVLNGKDLYDVEIGRLRGADYKVLVKEEDVYVENLKNLIEKSTGMYLSLFQENIFKSNVTIKALLENSFFGQNEEDENIKNKLGISGDNLMPDKIIKTYYEKIFYLLNQGLNSQDEQIQHYLNNLIKANGKIPKEIQDLLDSPDESRTSLAEYENDFDEGPQPGDAEYHYDSGHKRANNGQDVFANIDWVVFHQSLVRNTAIVKDKTEKGIAYNVSDYTDDDGLLSLSGLKHLEDYGLIYIHGGYPIIDDPKYLDYQTFYDEAKSIWLKDVRVNNDPASEPPPYRYGNEDSML